MKFIPVVVFALVFITLLLSGYTPENTLIISYLAGIFLAATCILVKIERKNG